MGVSDKELLEILRTERGEVMKEHARHAITHPMTSDCDECNDYIYAVVEFNWRIGTVLRRLDEASKANIGLK